VGMKRRMKFTDELRKAVRDSGQSQTEIWSALKVDKALLSRFLSGQGLGFDTLDKLAAYLDLHVSVGPKGQKAKGRG